MSHIFRKAKSNFPRHVLLDSDMVDWFMADPVAAAAFFRENRVQVLDSGFQTDGMQVVILTRDSVPGLGLAS